MRYFAQPLHFNIRKRADFAQSDDATAIAKKANRETGPDTPQPGERWHKQYFTGLAG